MRNVSRKVVIKNKPTEVRSTLTTVHRNQRNKSHKHFCSDTTCRLPYEDSCFTPEINGRCRSCKGQRRTWVEADGYHYLDPQPCCLDNTVLLIDPDSLARHHCAGPGPWYQCRRCKRTHGHPCTDPTLLGRPLAVANLEGTT